MEGRHGMLSIAASVGLVWALSVAEGLAAHPEIPEAEAVVVSVADNSDWERSQREELRRRERQQRRDDRRAQEHMRREQQRMIREQERMRQREHRRPPHPEMRRDHDRGDGRSGRRFDDGQWRPEELRRRGIDDGQYHPGRRF